MAKANEERTVGGSAVIGEPDLRQRIREVAYELFGEHGYHGTTTRMIASALGVSVPALYYHYGSKQELLVRVMRMDIEEAVATLRAAVEPYEDTLDALEAAVRANIQRRANLLDPRTIHRTEMRFIEPQHRGAIVKFRDEYEQVFKDLVQRCIDEGLTHTTESPSLLARAALQMMNGVSEWYRPGGRLTLLDLEDLYLRLVWSLFGIECPPPQASVALDVET